MSCSIKRPGLNFFKKSLIGQEIPADGVCCPNFQWRFWYAHWYSGLKAQCLVSIRSPLPTNAQWIDLIRIVQNVFICDPFLHLWAKTKKLLEKKKIHFWECLGYERNLITPFHFPLKLWPIDFKFDKHLSLLCQKLIGIFNAIYILVFCDYVIDILCRQPIKLFQVISTTEFHEY